VENTVRVLLAEQEKEILSLLTLSLSDIKECELAICSQPGDVITSVRETRPGLVLLRAVKEEEAASVLREIHETNPGVYVIVTMPDADEMAMDRLISIGAHDCVLKDRNYVANIVSAVKKALIRIAEREAFDIPVLERAQRFAIDENLPDIIFYFDFAGKVLYVNQAVTVLLGYEQKDVVGAEFSQLIAANMQRSFDAYLLHLNQTAHFRQKLPIKNSKGAIVNFDVNFTVVQGEMIYGVARISNGRASGSEAAEVEMQAVEDSGHQRHYQRVLGPIGS